jgi:hypothetical protein
MPSSPQALGAHCRRRRARWRSIRALHARRLLVEAALHYRLTPTVGAKLAIRQRGQDPALIDHA